MSKDNEKEFQNLDTASEADLMTAICIHWGCTALKSTPIKKTENPFLP
jgi:hypothetical protein